MKSKSFIENFQNNYIINKVDRTKIPSFEITDIRRKRIIFSGLVQGVGFRFETYQLANRLKLTGWVKNRLDKKVELEVQGEIDKIIYLTNHMKSLKRAIIINVTMEELPIKEDEVDFKIIQW